MRILLVLGAVAFALCTGCGSGSKSDTVAMRAGETPALTAGLVLSLQGPGGAVALGDDLAAAKKAYPAPQGAQVFDNSLSFAILEVDGWAWADEKTGIAFEAALKDGKIIALGLTHLGAAQPSSAVDDQKSAVGDPTRLAESDNAAMLVWESGENARFFIVFKAEVPMLGQGAMTLIGPKEQLKMLNYRHDDPGTFVKQIDAAMGVGVGTLSDPQLPRPDRLGEVKDFHKWTKVNPRPMVSSYWVDSLCVNPKPEDARRAATSPHRQKTITVWVNGVGRKAMQEGGAFPVGSTIVKDKREGADGAVELSTVMIKRPKAYNPACGDWEFAVLDKTGEKVEARGKIQTCAGCHVEQAKFDYVFRSYVPGKERSPSS